MSDLASLHTHTHTDNFQAYRRGSCGYCFAAAFRDWATKTHLENSLNKVHTSTPNAKVTDDGLLSLFHLSLLVTLHLLLL